MPSQAKIDAAIKAYTERLMPNERAAKERESMAFCFGGVKIPMRSAVQIDPDGEIHVLVIPRTMGEG
jgi:hypothetical protein